MGITCNPNGQWDKDVNNLPKCESKCYCNISYIICTYNPSGQRDKNVKDLPNVKVSAIAIVVISICTYNPGEQWDKDVNNLPKCESKCYCNCSYIYLHLQPWWAVEQECEGLA